MIFNELRAEQMRQSIDAEQVFSAYSSAREELDSRFAGSMFWRQVGGGTYLYRKIGASGRSLGPRSPDTEASHLAFHQGRDRLHERAKTLATRMDEMAPVNRAMGIGRLPRMSARVLRHLGAARLMGKAIDVVGTTALFAYERMGGIRIESGLLATGDIDLLYDSRRKLKLASNVEPAGLLGLLRQADRSFTVPRGSFRATNDEGFMVDLICPTARKRMAPSLRVGVGGADDLQAVEIEGLGWLVNSPKCKVIVIDERGYPLEMSVPDPRAFALHKAWLAGRSDRDPFKRQRDMGQARLVARIVKNRLTTTFDGDDLTALPAVLRRLAETILLSDENMPSGIEPNW